MSRHPNPIPQSAVQPTTTLQGGGQAPTAWVFRAGPQVVLVQGGNLPGRCVKCNLPGHGKPLHKTMYWHDPTWYLLILAGILIYAIVAICIRKKVNLDIALCQQHKKHRMVWITVMTLSLIIGVFLAIVGAVMESAPIGILGGLVFLFGLVAAVVASSGALRPTFIDDRVARLKGASEAFLSSLPDWPYR
ncbi:hypothetical protein OT109_13440 [Phycisphaeraceae bacterium D3-23]